MAAYKNFLNKEYAKSAEEIRTGSAFLKHRSELAATEEYQKAGQELKLSARYLEIGVKWTGRKIGKGTKTVIDNSRSLGDKLVKGSGRVGDEFPKGMSYLDNEIIELGNKINSEKKQ
ncbi:MAG TPA: hypothetical protein VMU10_01375 [Desulfomonilia bacterium]|nr:hypothetical protein [Desulfomonilia bacterium]